jgi:ABC-type transporter Mla subunit MlaD
MNVEANIAKIKSDMGHVTKSLDEFKGDTKAVLDRLSRTIDELAKNHHEIGGALAMMSSLQKQVNSNTGWISSRNEHVDDLIADKKDNIKRNKDLGWKAMWEVAKVVIIGLIGFKTFF